MRFNHSLKLCRLLVALLLFNIATPLAAASLNDSNTVLICTAAGFIEVNVDDMSEVPSSNAVDLHASQHCVFCKITDVDTFLNISEPAYLAPETDLVFNYQSIYPPSPQKFLIKHALMRAPPTVYL